MKACLRSAREIFLGFSVAYVLIDMGMYGHHLEGIQWLFKGLFN